MSYAIVSIGGKQYRVREGERLLVDRVSAEQGKTFHPSVLFLGGDGRAELAPKGVTVTARVVDHVLGNKIRIGKYRPKTGYRRHTGFRARLSQIEIENIGARKAAAKQASEPAAMESSKDLPEGYADLTVAQIAQAVPGWQRPTLDAALAYEREHAKRKGALAALESAIATREVKE